MSAILAGTALPAFPEAWEGKTPLLSTRIALGSTSQQVQVIIIAPALENEWLFKHMYLLWLASLSHSKSKGMSYYSTAKNSRKSLNTLIALPLVIPAGPAPGGQGLQGFAENVANTFKPGKCFFFGPEMGSRSEDPETGFEDTSGCKSFPLPHARSGMSMDGHPPNSQLVNTLLLSETFIASPSILVSCCLRDNVFKSQRSLTKGLLGRAHVLQPLLNAQGEVEMAELTNTPENTTSNGLQKDHAHFQTNCRFIYLQTDAI